MNFKIIIIFCLCSAALVSTVEAQDVWSLEKCINYAIKNNIQIKQGEVATNYQKNLLKQSKNARLPNLNGQVSQNWGFGKTLTFPSNTYQDVNSAQSDLGFATNVPIFSGFQLSNTILMTDLNLKASMEDLEKAKNDITMNIASSYLEVLFAKDLIKVTQDQLDVTNLQIRQINAKVEAGSLAKGSLLEIQAQAAGEELNLVNAQNQLKTAKLRLTQLLEMESQENFDVQVPVLPEIAAQSSLVSSTEVYKTALSQRPEIKGADYRVKSSKYQLKSAQGTLYPSISLYANIYDVYSNQYTDISGNAIPFNDQIKNNQRKGVGLQMNIPIFNRLQNRVQISNAQLQVLKSELDLEGAKKLLRSDIETAQTNATGALNRFNSNQKAVSSMREAFRYSQEKFNVGMVNAVEYNTAKTQLSKAESDLLQAKYEFIFRTKILDFYRGMPITL
jgi:outer membrane protein